MYINFWYAADWSHNLTTAPKKVRMLGHDIVLFRDSLDEWTRRGWVLESVPLVPASPVETGSTPVRAVQATG